MRFTILLSRDSEYTYDAEQSLEIRWGLIKEITLSPMKFGFGQADELRG